MAFAFVWPVVVLVGCSGVGVSKEDAAGAEARELGRVISDADSRLGQADKQADPRACVMGA